jgi:hypothetical protein
MQGIPMKQNQQQLRDKKKQSGRCDHIFRLLAERKSSEGFDGRGYYDKMSFIFFCQKCLLLRAKKEQLYYEEGEAGEIEDAGEATEEKTEEEFKEGDG